MIGLLPPELTPLFEARRSFIVERAVDPDLWRNVGWEAEPPNHFLDLDAEQYGTYPFDALPREYDLAVQKFGREAVDREGTLPWRTAEFYGRLQRAFESLVVAPILSLREDGEFMIRYSYFTMAPQRLPFSQMDGWYRAYRRFAAIVRSPAHQYRLRLEAGDFLLYDNHRMLHARTAFQGARWLRGVYFDAVGDEGKRSRPSARGEGLPPTQAAL